MDSILVLDTSGSMAGRSISELIRAVEGFIEITEQLGLQSKIALVEFGNNTGVRCHFTNDYTQLRRAARGLRAGGGTPMALGLALALKELVEHGRAINIEGIVLFPRIILMTDGAPDSESELLQISQAIGQAEFPIACVGVSGCNQRLMRQVAQMTDGMFLMAENVELLTIYFLEQVLIILYIVEMANQIENMLNRELLRQYLQEKTGRRVSDIEVDAFIAYLSGLMRRQQSSGSSSSSSSRSAPVRQRPAITNSSPSYTPSYNRSYGSSSYSYPARSSSQCCCTIL